MGGLGRRQAVAQRALRGGEVVAALRGSLGKRRIGEMAGVVDAAALLLGKDLIVQFARHALELGNHRLDLTDLATLLLDLKALQAKGSFARFHQRNSYSLPHSRRQIGARATLYATIAATTPGRGNHSFTSRVNDGPGSLNSA